MSSFFPSWALKVVLVWQSVNDTLRSLLETLEKKAKTLIAICPSMSNILLFFSKDKSHFRAFFLSSANVLKMDESTNLSSNENFRDSELYIHGGESRDTTTTTMTDI